MILCLNPGITKIVFSIQLLYQKITKRAISINRSTTPAIAEVIDLIVPSQYNICMRPYGEITKQILLGVGIAGVVIVVAAAPGVLLAAKLFEQNQRQFPKKYENKKAARAIQRLQRNNLLAVKENKGKFVVELTKEGKQKFKEIQHRENLLKNLQIVKPARWDGKWRIVVFDIPDNSHKQARDVLRGKLKRWEFYPLQKSVWVCPWPCENEIQLAAELYGISRYVNVAVAERISGDAVLRKHFGL